MIQENKLWYIYSVTYSIYCFILLRLFFFINNCKLQLLLLLLLVLLFLLLLLLSSVSLSMSSLFLRNVILYPVAQASPSSCLAIGSDNVSCVLIGWLFPSMCSSIPFVNLCYRWAVGQCCCCRCLNYVVLDDLVLYIFLFCFVGWHCSGVAIIGPLTDCS